MVNLTFLAELSRIHCIAICSFLVPANLLATSLTLLSLYFQRPTRQILPIAAVASLLACTLFLHVNTWLIIGVIRIPTFVLWGLGLTCLVVNLKAITDTQRFGQFLHKIIAMAKIGLLNLQLRLKQDLGQLQKQQ